jgi:hypothetical protein
MVLVEEATVYEAQTLTLTFEVDRVLFFPMFIVLDYCIIISINLFWLFD